MKLVGRNLRHLQELLVGDHGVFVEEEQEEHLVARAEEFIPFTFLERASDLSVPQSQFPVQQASIVELGVVELSERVHGDANLIWNLLKELCIFLVIWPVTLREHFN